MINIRDLRVRIGINVLLFIPRVKLHDGAPQEISIQMGVYLSRSNRCMAEHLLDSA